MDVTEMEFALKLAETEKRQLEIRLQDAISRTIRLEKALKTAGMTDEDIQRARIHDADRYDHQIVTLEARIKVLEAENEALRVLKDNTSTVSKKPKSQSVGRPSIPTWEQKQMREYRKAGWTVRAIAAHFGRSVGAVSRIVSDN